MGQLRNAFRAHAYEHTSPADVLRRMLRHVDEDEMATALCLTLDPYTQELTYASAGHPPSLLVDGDSAVVARLGHALAPPLGYVDPSAIREARSSCPRAARSSRTPTASSSSAGWSIDTGIDLLASVVGASSSLGADPLADRIFEEVAPHIGSSRRHRAPDRPPARGAPAHGHRDAVRPGGPRRPAPASAHWLELRGLAEDERDDTVLAVSEACNNAIEHAYRRGAGHDPSAARASRRRALDPHRGPRRLAPTTPSFERGRGIPLMRAVMDMTTIEHDERGTSVTLSRLLA